MPQARKKAAAKPAQPQKPAPPEAPLKKRAGAKAKAARKIPPAMKQLLQNAPEAPFYTRLKPMLATLVDKAFDDPDWTYEIKWDGYRALAFMQDGQVLLKSRNDKSFNEKFYPIHDALEDWGIDAVIDGEVVVVGEDGRASFGALQNWRSEADGTLLYYAFDITWYAGYDLSGLPLSTRKEILGRLVTEEGLIQVSQDFDTSGTEFLEAAREMGLEGIMAKRKDSVYTAGDRNTDWLKIKAMKRQEVVIGGYTVNHDTSKPFSALLVGVFEKGKFTYTGKVGTGFSVKQQEEMLRSFAPYRVKKPAFAEEPDVNKPSRFRPDPPHADAYWLKPALVCEVSYTELTADKVMRHPSFQGMRTDKMPRQVLLELEKDTGEAVAATGKDKRLYVKPPPGRGRRTLLNPSEATQVRKVGGQTLKFSNLHKVFWPEEGYTKRDLINYYYQVAPYILPYLKDRPQSLNRFPNGIDGKSFYQKDVTGKVPGWAQTYLYHSEDDSRDKHFLLGNDEATLLYMAGMGCIEMNPWSSTIKKPDHPDFCIIDLDPDKNDFNQVVQAAQVTNRLLENLGISSYPKTSGATGLHIYIPLGRKYTYEQSKEFARMIVTLVQRELPRFTSIERATRDRKGKIYLDFLQNRPQATVAAPYSVRPRPGAMVSMPLHWDEVKKGLKMTDFTISNAPDRIRAEGDLFRPVLGKGIDLARVLRKAGSLI